jgi:hypothetical protein
MKKLLATLVILTALAAPCLADCTDPGQTNSPPGPGPQCSIATTNPDDPGDALTLPVSEVKAEVGFDGVVRSIILLAISVW